MQLYTYCFIYLSVDVFLSILFRVSWDSRMCSLGKFGKHSVIMFLCGLFLYCFVLFLVLSLSPYAPESKALGISQSPRDDSGFRRAISGCLLS